MRPQNITKAMQVHVHLHPLFLLTNAHHLAHKMLIIAANMALTPMLHCPAKLYWQNTSLSVSFFSISLVGSLVVVCRHTIIKFLVAQWHLTNINTVVDLESIWLERAIVGDESSHLTSSLFFVCLPSAEELDSAVFPFNLWSIIIMIDPLAKFSVISAHTHILLIYKSVMPFSI